MAKEPSKSISSSSLVQPNGKGKAKQRDPNPDDPSDLIQLVDQLTANVHLLIPGKSDATLLAQANAVVKSSFDRALLSELTAFANLAALLQTMTPSTGPSTRSKANSMPVVDDYPPPELNPTPLAELTTDGMDPEMVWEQMEMRTAVVVELLETMFGGGDGSDDDADGGSGSEDELEGSDEEDADEFGVEGDRVGERSGESSSSENEDEDEDEDSESATSLGFEEHDEYVRKLDSDSVDGGAEGDEDPLADENKDLSLSTFDKPGSGKSRHRISGPPSAVDDQFFSLHDFHMATDEGEFEMDRALRGEVDEDDEDDGVDLFAPVGSSTGGDNEDEEEDEEEEDLDAAGIMYKDFFDPPPRPVGNVKSNRKGKTTISERLNPRSPKGKGKDPTSVNLPPAPGAADGEPKRKRSVRFSDAVKVKTIAARQSEFDRLVAKVGWEKAAAFLGEMENQGAGGDEEDEAMLSDDDLDDEEETSSGDENLGEDDEDEDALDEEDFEMGDDEESSGSEDAGLETIERLKTSLFDEEEDEEEEGTSKAAALSRHERRLLALSSQIAALEAENVGPKDWATKGEAKAKDRPVNSLLEEDLEYERAGKVVPVITEETTKTIEDLIKKRILDNQFDDVVRRRAVDPNAFLPSRFMELQDTKSNKSLAEIYEEDYTASKEKDAGRAVVHELDQDLEKKHAEIEELFEELSSKLDALSNARFTPKPPKATITTISNVGSVSLESALPTTSSTATLLAPEEVFVPDPTKEDRSDFTPSQKKAARQKRRKARASMAQAAEKFSKGAKGEKERATKQLLGTRGVTVLGKGAGKGVGKDIKSLKRKRSADDEGGGRSGVSLKL